MALEPGGLKLELNCADASLGAGFILFARSGTGNPDCADNVASRLNGHAAGGEHQTFNLAYRKWLGEAVGHGRCDRVEIYRGVGFLPADLKRDAIRGAQAETLEAAFIALIETQRRAMESEAA